MSREASPAGAVGETQRPEISGFLLQALASYISQIEPEPKQELSYREFEVLSLVAEGFGTVEIGKILPISPATVSNHRMRILRKLEVDPTRSRMNQMKSGIRKAYKFGYLPDPNKERTFPGDLTPRQAQVLWLGANGYGINVIAGVLGISRNTVNTHTDKAVDNLGAANPCHAISLAIEDGQVSTLSDKEARVLLPLALTVQLEENQA